MKNLYPFLFVALLGFVANAQTIAFPDPILKSKLLAASTTNNIALDCNDNSIVIDSNNDNEIQVIEALAVCKLDVSSVSQQTIENMTGINAFSNLKSLKCAGNYFESMDLSSMNQLQYLDCSWNYILATITFHPDANLFYFDATYNHISSFAFISNMTNLTYFSCKGNAIISLNLTNLINLEDLRCGVSQIASLDLHTLINLKSLECGYAFLTNLDLSNCPLLEELYCGENALPALDVSNLNQLKKLWCSYNQLTHLDLNNLPNLQLLQCTNNGITSLDLHNQNQLTYIDCRNNNLQTLFIKNGVADGTGALFFSNNPNLIYICADEIEIIALQNNLANEGILNCTVNNYCNFYGNNNTISGQLIYDTDNNGCNYDANKLINADLVFENVKLTLGDETTPQITYSNTNGQYVFNYLQAGTYTIIPSIPDPYFIISPASANVTFTDNNNNTQNLNFCITPNGTHNDLETTIIPLRSARPGWDISYRLQYKNKGTQTMSGSINVNYDDAIFDFVEASPLAGGQSINNLTWNFSDLVPYESHLIYFKLHLNSSVDSPPVVEGDVLHIIASINPIASDETPFNNTSTLNQIAVYPYDPNDKTCTEGTTITPTMVGDYVHYVIRFENDGTAEAQNIVVKDMIDTTKFDITTLMPISSSSPYTTRITNTNRVEFFFENINLPYSTGSNTGYVAFKIKTKPTLVLGNTFSNSASIFFDYNAPIVTNTFTTTVAALATQDFNFGTYFNVFPSPAKQELNLQTNAPIALTSIEIYNVLGQLMMALPNAAGISTIDVSTLKTGTYFIKVNTDKGIANAKFVKE